MPLAPAAPPVRARTVTRELTQATVYLGRPGIGWDHPDYYPLRVANYILGGGSASRLYTAVRDQAGLAYSVWSYAAARRYGAVLVVGLQTRTEGLAKALQLIRAEMARMGEEPVSEQELALAQAYLTGSFPLRMDTSGELANLLLTVEAFGLGLDYPDRFKEQVEQVTAADIERVAKIYLDPTTFSTVSVGKLD